MQPLVLCRFGSEKGAKKGFRAQMLDTKIAADYFMKCNHVKIKAI